MLTTKRHIKFMAIASAAALALTACSATGSSSSASQSGPDLEVTTSFYPITYLVQEIGGTHVGITDLTPSGGSAHDAEIAPSDVAMMQKSDLVFYLESMSPAIDEAVASAGIKNAVNVGEAANLVKQTEIAQVSQSVGGTTDEHSDEDGHTDEHADETADKHTDEHADETADEHTDEHADETADEHTDEHADETTHTDEDGHDHGEYDPHFWTDPARLAAVAKVVGEQLAKADSANADTYTANAATVSAKLTKLADDFKNKVATQQCSTKSFVVTHLAFGYLALQNNLQQIGIAGFDPEVEPSPARIAELKKTLTESKVTTVFATSDAEKKVAQAVATEIGAKVELLDPAATQLDANKDYAAIMEENFTKLLTSFGCN